MSDLKQEIRNLEKGKAVMQKTKIKKEKPTSNNRSFETLDIVNSAGLWQDVLKHKVYTCPLDGKPYQHRKCKYLGVYWDKRVGAIGEIEAVVQVYSENKAEIQWINGNQSADDYLAKAKEKAIQLRPSDLPLRVFLLTNLSSTDFTKDSKGGMFGSKIYLNVEDLNVADAEELSKKLQGKNWSEFGL